MKKILVITFLLVSMFASALEIEQIQTMPVYAYYGVLDSKVADNLYDFMYLEDYYFVSDITETSIFVRVQYHISQNSLTLFYTLYEEDPVRFMYYLDSTLDGLYISSLVMFDSDGSQVEVTEVEAILLFKRMMM